MSSRRQPDPRFKCSLVDVKKDCDRQSMRTPIAVKDTDGNYWYVYACANCMSKVTKR